MHQNSKIIRTFARIQNIMESKSELAERTGNLLNEPNPSKVPNYPSWDMKGPARREAMRNYLNYIRSDPERLANFRAQSDSAGESLVTGAQTMRQTYAGRPEAEVQSRLANYEKGARDSRIANIRSSDPQSANALERAYRADERGKKAAQQWGQIGSDIGKEMDDIEDSMSQRKIDAFKRDRQREKDTQAQIDAESQRETDNAVRGMQGAGKIQDKIFGYKTAISNVGKPSSINPNSMSSKYDPARFGGTQNQQSNSPAARPSQQTSSTISNRQQPPTQQPQRQSGPGLGRSEPFMDARNQTGTSSSTNGSPTVGQTGLGIMASKNQQTQSGIRPMA